MRCQMNHFENSPAISDIFDEFLSNTDGDDHGQSGAAVVSEVRTVVKEPKMYKVLLHNDDFTPMDFVVFVLEHFFNKSKTSAEKIMMDVHEKGVGTCGVYPFEVAETKVQAVLDAAKENEYPLLCSCEED